MVNSLNHTDGVPAPLSPEDLEKLVTPNQNPNSSKP